MKDDDYLDLCELRGKLKDIKLDFAVAREHFQDAMISLECDVMDLMELSNNILARSERGGDDE